MLYTIYNQEFISVQLKTYLVKFKIHKTNIMLNHQYIDNFLFVITGISSLAFCYIINRKKPLHLSKAYIFSLVFLSLYTLLNICAHLIAVAAVAIVKAKAGIFAYDLRFYTLLQFGVLLVIINVYLLRKTIRIIRGDWDNYRGIYKACILQILISLPLVPFNPLSLLPFITSVPLMLLVYRASRRYVLVSESEAAITAPELRLNTIAG